MSDLIFQNLDLIEKDATMKKTLRNIDQKNEEVRTFSNHFKQDRFTTRFKTAFNPVIAAERSRASKKTSKLFGVGDPCKGWRT